MAALFTIAILTTTMNGCKKGENDPLISLKSRDSRITGIWVLSKVDMKSANSNNYSGDIVNSSITDAFDGTSWTHVESGTTTSWSYSYEVTIEKDGTFSSVEVSNGDKTEETGYWNWLDSKKNKTGILLGGSILTIDQLKNKELITIDNTFDKDTDSDGDFSSNTNTDTRTYTKK